MPKIFISYRRIDTGPSAKQFYDDLSRRFGKYRVFMDTEDIRAGTNYVETLRAQLAECDVLLALIGSQWVNCERDGRRRLDFPDDWVREEIITAMNRKIPLIPVLMNDVQPPEKSEFPENPELQLFCEQQAIKFSETCWDDDIRNLVKEVVKFTSRKSIAENDYSLVSTGLQLLTDLMTEPEVAGIVGRSQERIEQTCRQLQKLELFKRIHDAFHNIETYFQSIVAQGAKSPIKHQKSLFDEQVKLIRHSIQNAEIQSGLRELIIGQLDSTTEAFKVAIENQNKENRAILIGELSTLLSVIPTRLDQCIVSAAAELELERIADLMSELQDILTSGTTQDFPKYERLICGIDVLRQIGCELATRVNEHTLLQHLDSELRTIYAGNIGISPRIWESIQVRARNLLKPPFSETLDNRIKEMEEKEAEIQSALDQKNKTIINDAVAEYFWRLTAIFQNVDSALKDFCNKLTHL